MKTKATIGTLFALVMGLLSAASFAAAGSDVGADRVTAKIPFEFVAGAMRYPAGTYIFEINDPDLRNAMTVETPDGKRTQFILGEETAAETAHYHSAVVFDEVGQQHFLVKAYAAGKMRGLRLTKSEVQKELERGGQKAKMLEIEATPK